MTARYHCHSEQRRDRVRDTAVPLNGIDYLEVHTPTDTTQPTTLEVVFLKPDGVAGLSAANIRVEGGARFRDPPIAPPVVTAAASAVLTVTMAAPGPLPRPQFPLTDYSTYRLKLVDVSGAAPPPGFDPLLCEVDFSFKVECPSPFDCREPAETISTPASREPDLDYGARDWPTFRQLMLDRLAALLPNAPIDTPVDFLVTQVEALASVADHLSYRLDAVATESSIFTARSRVSLARHGRLLDYTVHEGCNARTFVQFGYQPGSSSPPSVSLPAGTPLTTSQPGAQPGADTTLSVAGFAELLNNPPLVFETVHDVTLHSGNNAIAFHTWSDSLCRLPKGATRATFRTQLSSGAPLAELKVGDFMLLHQTIDPTTGELHDDRRLRHVVRLTAVTPTTDLVEGVDVLDVEWLAADALPFDLTLSSEVVRQGLTSAIVCAQAAANIALADHGVTLPPRGVSTAKADALAPRLEPPLAPGHTAWRPKISRAELARIVRPDLGVPLQVASALRTCDPAEALPALTLTDAYDRWQVRPTLLASQRFAREVIVETESDGTVFLRFGDNVLGLMPAAGTALTVAGRFGRPSDGMIGADVLSRVATDIDGIIAVRNPLPAFGAVEPVSAATVRIEAPEQFRIQRRAVTEEDYAAVAKRFPGVQSAMARIRWTGAWRTAFVYVDREGGLPVESDRTFMAGLAAHLERHRLAGVDMAIRGAVFVPLDITLRVCVCPGVLRAEVLHGLLQRLGSGVTPDGARGFFHPDNFTFGTPLYLSRLLSAALEVSGVASVEATDFRRWARAASGELAAGLVPAGELQVLQVANDPSRPEQGRIAFELVGGL